MEIANLLLIVSVLTQSKIMEIVGIIAWLGYLYFEIRTEKDNVKIVAYILLGMIVISTVIKIV